MAKGRKTGGRQKGTPNKARAAIIAAVQAEIAEVVASGEAPLQYMLRVMRDPNADVARRDAMAVKAAPYLHPQLASVRQQNEQVGRVVHEVRWIDESDECPDH